MLPVVILAGGLATRMRPMTETVPKALLEVAGSPFIDHQFNLLLKNGIKRVILCIGHLGWQIEQYLAGRNYGIEVIFSYDGDVPMGTGGAIKKALPFINEAFFVLYGDSYLDICFATVEQAWRNSCKPALMTVYCNDNNWDTSNVSFKDDRILHYSKINRTKDMRYIDYGLSILSTNALSDFSGRFDLAEVYERLAERGELTGYESMQRFYEIGSPGGLRELEKILKGS